MSSYQRNVVSYRRKTSHLTLVEHGVYAVLLDHYYDTKSPLPGSLDQIMRICRATSPEEMLAVESVINQFFILVDNSYHNRRADEEIRTGGVPPTPIAQDYFLPDWVPKEEWAAYINVRARLNGADNSKTTLKRLITVLQNLMVQGQDPSKVLDQSTIRGWKTLQAVETFGGSNGRTRYDNPINTGKSIHQPSKSSDNHRREVLASVIERRSHINPPPCNVDWPGTYSD